MPLNGMKFGKLTGVFQNVFGGSGSFYSVSVSGVFVHAILSCFCKHDKYVFGCC